MFNKSKKNKSEPIGIGGWLIFVAIGVYLSPLFIIGDFFEYFNILANDNVWNILTDPKSPKYNSIASTILSLIIFFQLLSFFLYFYLIHLFAYKKKVFIQWFILLSFFNFSLFFFSELSINYITNNSIASFNAIQLVAPLIALLLWTLYMIKSIRVKNTFINNDEYKLTPLYVSLILSFLFSTISIINLNNPSTPINVNVVHKIDKKVPFIKTSEYSNIVKTLESYNKELPKKIDEFTTYDKIKVDGMKIKYEYSILYNYSVLNQSMLPGIFQELKSNGTFSFCSNRSIKTFLKLGFIIEPSYYSLDHKHLFKYNINYNNCTK